MENRTASFTSASVFPAKILANPELIREIRQKKLIPCWHVQLNPTNRCNLSCPFCSCSERDKRIELSYDEIMEIMTKAKKVGCKSVTITGGGEPLIHPRINDIIKGIKNLEIDIGIVTNGLLLGQVPTEILSMITWIRISSGDYRDFGKRYEEMLSGVVERGNNVDFAFSHVVGKHPNYDTIIELVKFANNHRFTHIRLVSDLLDLESSKDMEAIKEKLKEHGVDDSLVIYQGRKEFTKGTQKCYISLLKPVITPNGKIVACCGWQYRKSNISRDYDTEENMCNAKDIDKFYEKQSYYDGSGCDRCYYSAYNNALEVLLSEIKHKQFV